LDISALNDGFLYDIWTVNFSPEFSMHETTPGMIASKQHFVRLAAQQKSITLMTVFG
jgi:hypothetical protein